LEKDHRERFDLSLSKEHYQKFLDGEEEILYIAKEDDP
jgi:hypothetical protein